MRWGSIFFNLVWKIAFSVVFVLSFGELFFSIPQVKALSTYERHLTSDESFDPRLSRINSMKKLEMYSDSVYKNATVRKGRGVPYPAVLNDIVYSRFYHGYLRYNAGNNFLAMFAGKASSRSYDDILVPEDIMKFSEAACKQQSLVMMKLLRKKGYPVRGLYMKSKRYNTEHFTFEVFYDNSWHFFDPDMEPNARLLNEMDRPSVATLAKDTLLIECIYSHGQRDPSMMIDLLRSYQYEKINVLIPARTIIFRNVTRFFSYTGWIFCLIIYIFMYRNRHGIQ